MAVTVDLAVSCDNVPDVCMSPGWQGAGVERAMLDVIRPKRSCPGCTFACLAVGPQARPFTPLSLGCLGPAGFPCRTTQQLSLPPLLPLPVCWGYDGAIWGRPSASEQEDWGA